MALAEVIDLCSDDSITVTTTGTAIGVSVSAARSLFATNSSSAPKSRPSASLSDIELELDAFLPQRPPKRRRIDANDSQPMDIADELEHRAGRNSQQQQNDTMPSDVACLPSGRAPRMAIDLFDPISSSPLPIPISKKSAIRPEEALSNHLLPLDSDEWGFLSEDIDESANGAPALPNATSTQLAEISANAGAKGKQRETKQGSSRNIEYRPIAMSKQDRAALRKDEQAARQAAKDAVKAAAAEQKLRERERKAMEKELAANHAEANKARWDKKVATPEMLVDVPAIMAEGHMATELQKVLKELDVECTTYEGSVVKWRRKSKTVFNREKQHWELRPETIINEAHVLCITSAADFVQQALAGDNALDGYVQEVQATFADCQILYVIEGLESYLKKQRNAKNRSYVAAVRQEAAASPSKSRTAKSPTKSRTAEPPPPVVDEERIEDALISLPIRTGVYIFQTVNALETAEWIGDFTQHIATVPYK